MILGQEFEAYTVTLEKEVEKLCQNARLFLEVNMESTAGGTVIHSDPGNITGLDFCLVQILQKQPRITDVL